MPVDIYHRAVGGDRHAHEEVDVADDVAAVEPELRQGLDEIGETAMRATDAVAQEIVGLAAAAIDRVVPAAGIFDDREQRLAEIGIQNRALVDEQFTLDLDRVGGAVAVGPVLYGLNYANADMVGHTG